MTPRCGTMEGVGGPQQEQIPWSREDGAWEDELKGKWMRRGQLLQKGEREKGTWELKESVGSKDVCDFKKIYV